MIKHFVTFLSPGTLFAENTTKPIESWDVYVAFKMSEDILERYGATPYGFYFTTRERGEDDFDSREVKRSPTYFLGGEILTLEQIVEMDDPSNRILISNMRANGWSRVVKNSNSWDWVQPLEDTDIVLGRM